jgi:two-component system sensor histidine kinase PilS (NtrC family)
MTKNQKEHKPPAQNFPRPRSWRMLHLFLAYRLFLSILLLILFFGEFGPVFLGAHDPGLFILVGAGYLAAVLATGVLLFLRTLDDQQQSYLMVFTDIVAIILLMHASGGVPTGLGMLLMVSIAFGSTVMRGSAAHAFASIATVAILGEQLYSHLQGIFPATAYTQAGILGASFFAIAILTDVLSRRLRESEQLASQRELDLANLAQLNEYIIQHMQAGIIVVDKNRRIRLINEAARHLLGIQKEKSHPLLHRISKELAIQLSRWEKGKKVPSAFQTSSGGRELQARFMPLGNEQRAGILVLLDDAAMVKQRAQQMKLASLGRLTASIAHEIRNPLGAISHAEQLLVESSNLDSSDRRLAEIIHSNSERVNEIIENVMQISRRQPSRSEEIELTNWLQRFVQDFRLNRPLTDQNLQLEVPPLKIPVSADPSQLHQVMTVLCENAVCHFEGPEQELRLKILCGITSDTKSPFLDVEDNGPGVTPEAGRQMFEPFFTTHNKGSGLGLFIAKELCEANRLGLDYIDRPEKGSCFRISFPMYIRAKK